MARVLANGVFDILHPGHIHYLEESAALGEELHVVVTPDSMTEKNTVFTAAERVHLLNALQCVDKAFTGSTGKDHVLETMRRVQPDIVTLGYDQDFTVSTLQNRLQEHGFDIAVVRIKAYPGGEMSSTRIREHIREQD